MTRLVDRLLRRSDYWEGMASGAAVLTTTYTSQDKEPILPHVASANIQQHGSNAVAFSAILTRMMMLSEAELKFRRARDKSLFGDPRLGILERPWPGGTTGELLARMEQDVSVAGNAFLWMTDGGQLIRRRPDWCTIVSKFEYDAHGRPYRVPIGLFYDPPKTALPDYGEPEYYDWDEIIHWAPIPDPQANFRGMSWMTPVYRDLMSDTGMTAYKIKYLDHAATPNLMLKYAQKLQPATIDSLRQRMADRYGGVDNAFRTIVLDQGADLTVVGSTLSQMDFSNVLQAGADRILAASMVPQVMVGLEPLRGAGRSYQETVVKFGNLWARPQWRSVCGALQKAVAGADTEAGAVRLWYDTSDIAALQDTETNQAQSSLVRAQALLVMVQAGFTRDSAVAATVAGDISQLVPDPDAAPAQQPGQVQHMLPNMNKGGDANGTALPPGSTPRLSVATASPGDGGNGTRPAIRPAAVRRP